MKHIFGTAEMRKLTKEQRQKVFEREQKELFNQASKADKRNWFERLIQEERYAERNKGLGFHVYWFDKAPDSDHIALWESTSGPKHGYSLDFKTILRWLGFSWRKLGL